MISINEHIRYLLMHHDCVIVPGLGAFIAQSCSASFDPATGVFTPPCRMLSFNPSISHDDGVLVASIVRREGVGYETARTLIANEVAMLRSRIDSSGAALMPRFGVFQRSAGTLLFEPDASSSLMDSRFLGLSPLQLTPAVQTFEEPAEEPKVLNVNFRQRKLVRWARVAASVVVLLGLGVALSTPVLVDRTGLQYASVGVPKVIKGVEPIILETETFEAADTAGTRQLFVVAPDRQTSTGTARLKKFYKYIAEPTVAPEPVKSNYYAHYLIVASCETRRRAERFVRNHSADNLQIVESDGRFRVYITASNSRLDCEIPRIDVAKRYPGAWIYSR